MTDEWAPRYRILGSRARWQDALGDLCILTSEATRLRIAGKNTDKVMAERAKFTKFLLDAIERKAKGKSNETQS